MVRGYGFGGHRRWPHTSGRAGGAVLGGVAVDADVSAHFGQCLAHGGGVLDQVGVGVAVVVGTIHGVPGLPHGLVDLCAPGAVVPVLHRFSVIAVGSVVTVSI